MSSIAQTGNKCGGIAVNGKLINLLKPLTTFFRSSNISRAPRIYHRDHYYDTMPDIAFCEFMHMSDITLIETGDCYVYIFDKPNYQGNYYVAGPGEVVPVFKCGSVVISTKKLAISAIQNRGCPPPGFWEVSGSKYQWHCSTAYKYV